MTVLTLNQLALATLRISIASKEQLRTLCTFVQDNATLRLHHCC
jgi:hypothetical protein